MPRTDQWTDTQTTNVVTHTFTVPTGHGVPPGSTLLISYDCDSAAVTMTAVDSSPPRVSSSGRPRR